MLSTRPRRSRQVGSVRDPQELEAGLGLSRLSRDDFLRFMQLAAFFTAYVRLKHVRCKTNGPAHGTVNLPHFCKSFRFFSALSQQAFTRGY